MVAPYGALLAVLALERLWELVLSRRHAAMVLARGGFEVGRGHFRVMALVHAVFLPACAVEVLCLHRPFVAALGMPMCVLVVLAQALRYWSVHTLAWRWNVRIFVVPGEPAVASGPYRYLRHPNYLAVLIEGVAVPLVHGAWLTAVAFTLVNVPLLAVRIGCEEQALRRYCAYAERLGDRSRLLPL